jgi:hypothetical protein
MPGPRERKVRIPTAAASPVRSKMSQPAATVCIHDPAAEIVRPTSARRKAP